MPPFAETIGLPALPKPGDMQRISSDEDTAVPPLGVAPTRGAAVNRPMPLARCLGVRRREVRPTHRARSSPVAVSPQPRRALGRWPRTIMSGC